MNTRALQFSNLSLISKTHLSFLFILISLLAFSQKSEVNFSPDGVFDNVFDDKGNKYHLSDISIKQTDSAQNGVLKNSLLCSSGIFELYFEAGCGMEIVGNTTHDQRRAIICQAFTDMSNFINTPLKNTGNTTKVKIWVRNPGAIGLPAGAAGAGSSFYNLPLMNGSIANQTSAIKGIVDNEIWKTINSGKDSYSTTLFPLSSTVQNTNFFHGYLSFSFNTPANWNLDLNKYNSSTGYPLNSSDFYTVVIHELTHLLGFNSLIKSDGNSMLFSNANLGLFGYYFTRYDKFLKSATNIPLLSNSYAGSSNCQMYDYRFNPSISTSVIYPQCGSGTTYEGNSGLFNCSSSIVYSGSVTVPVYTPPCYEHGSSLSHFEDACFNNYSNDQYFMMSDRLSGLFAKRTLTTQERLTLCDIGYSLNTTFGSTSNNTYKDYNTTTCPGIGVAGVNDGLNSNGGFLFQGIISSQILISGILNNDHTNGNLNNLRYEYLQDLNDPNANFNRRSGSANDSFSFMSFIPGTHVLRYVPYDSVTGKRGNITYIYVNVLNYCYQEDLCNLVKNGGFENYSSLPDYTSQIYKSCGWENISYRTTADYLHTDAATASLKVPCNLFGFQNDKINGNNAYAGMFIRSDYSETIKTELAENLDPNTQYTLSFDVSLADRYKQRAIKFQALLSDSKIDLNNGGFIPSNYINNNVVFLTNTTFSNADSANRDGWETISFTFTTGNNPNLKYLYLGGLNNVSYQIENTPNTDCDGAPVANYNAESYYFIDNVKLVPVLPVNFLIANDDDFTATPINTSNGGLTNSVYSNDYYDQILNNQSNISDVVFSLAEFSPIPGISINNMGQILIPQNTPAGNYDITYILKTLNNCVFDTANVRIAIDNVLSVTNPSYPNIKVFPNPTSGLIYLDNSKGNYQSVSVYNVLGQKIDSQDLKISNNETINLTGLSNGVYFLNFTGLSNPVIKIIKE